MSRSAFLSSRSVLALFTFLAGFALPEVSEVDVSKTYGKLPLHFEANRGQTDEQVRFLARGPGYGLYLTANEAVLVLAKPSQEARRNELLHARLEQGTSAVPSTSEQTHTQAMRRPQDVQAKAQSVALRMTLVGATPNPIVTGLDELPGKANYFIGRDPSKWRTNVPTYAKVHYREVYPGIDLVYYGNQRHLEYDFVVAPGADPQKIALRFDGADKLEIDTRGDLVVQAAGGDVRLKKLVIYQDIDGVRKEIAGGYVLKSANRVAFQLAAYDTSRPLIIDPVLAYSTYLGGSGTEAASGIAVDTAGNAYATGHTKSLDFPTTSGTFQGTRGSGDYDAFVAKLNTTGSALVYSTYLGGSSAFDLANGIAVDATGNAYVTGYTYVPNSTNPSDFPRTAGSFQGTSGVFVTKLDPTGSALVYSAVGIGGQGIAVDAAGNAYVGGRTTGGVPTTPGALKTTPPHASDYDLYVTKLNPAGSALVYSTYLDVGSDSQWFGGIAVDAFGNAYVTGGTNAELSDVFVTKLNPAGSALVYSTYFGGSGIDGGNGIAVDSAGNAYVTGSTGPFGPTNFPTTPGAFDTTSNGDRDVFVTDAFVTKLDSSGSLLVYSTYLGGSGKDYGQAIAVDAAGNAYVAGITYSSDFPTTAGAFQTTCGGSGCGDAFVTKLNPSGSALVYSTYLGGSGGDWGAGIAVDAAGSAYVTGGTGSLDFPTTPGAFQPINLGGGDAFVAKFTNEAPTVVLLALHENGSDGSTTFIDASSSRHALTPAAQAQWDTAQAPAGLTSSGLFDGDADQIEAASHADFEFGRGDFTVEFFLRLNAINKYAIIFDMRAGAPGEVGLNIFHSPLGELLYSVNDTPFITSPSGQLVVNTWYHVAVARAGGATKMFVNGTQVGTTYADNNHYSQGHILIGNRYAGANLAVDGWMAGVRVTKGGARYTSNFTPPALPYLEGQGTRSEEGAATYTGSWNTYGSETGTFSGGTIAASNVALSTATFSFTGTAVTWIGVKCSICGIATVSIDGGLPTVVNTTGPAGSNFTSEPVFSASGLDPGVPHTMVITVTGTSTSLPSLLTGGNHIAVDAFDVTR